MACVAIGRRDSDPLLTTNRIECMAIRIKARAGESAEQMLRRFKKLCEKEGLTKDVKKHAYYEKPSERRRRAMRKTVKRVVNPRETSGSGSRSSGGRSSGGRGSRS